MIFIVLNNIRPMRKFNFRFVHFDSFLYLANFAWIPWTWFSINKLFEIVKNLLLLLERFNNLEFLFRFKSFHELVFTNKSWAIFFKFKFFPLNLDFRFLNQLVISLIVFSISISDFGIRDGRATGRSFD